MCGQANCVPFGCVVGEAIAHLGTANIVIGLSLIFSTGTALGYLLSTKRAHARYLAVTTKNLPAVDADASHEAR